MMSAALAKATRGRIAGSAALARATFGRFDAGGAPVGASAPDGLFEGAQVAGGAAGARTWSQAASARVKGQP